MSQFSHYEPCPKCRAIGRDNRGDNFAVYRDGSKHCFSCGNHYFSTFNYWKNRSLTDINHVAKSLLPGDFTREVPARAWKWLLQYGLPYSYWQPYAGYSPSEQRLVITVGTPIQFSIGRYIPDGNEHGGTGAVLSGGNPAATAGVRVGARQASRHLVSATETGTSSNDASSTTNHSEGQGNSDASRHSAEHSSLAGLRVAEGNKWGVDSKANKQNDPPRKWYVWGDSHKHAELMQPAGATEQQREFVVVVEDVVSAHKVGQVHECMPIFGTRLYNPHLYHLINANKPVALWLDKDQELLVKKQALKLESIIGQPVRVITTEKDPKELSYEQIKEVLYQ